MTPLLGMFSGASARGFGRGISLSSVRQQAYTTPGVYTFTVPASVTEISVLCIGGGEGGSRNSAGDGGGLAYDNAISVTPLENLTVKVGAGGTGIAVNGTPNAGVSSSLDRSGTVLCLARGGGTTTTQVGDVTYLGGNGPANVIAGGGGAAGYSAAGGAGASIGTGTSATGGGGGGGASGGGSPSVAGGGGGGVGLLGAGSNGSGGGPSPGIGGGGGSGGTSGSTSTTVNGANGGDYGGGGGAANTTGTGGTGGGGAVRIIWGAGRSYPSNAADV